MATSNPADVINLGLMEPDPVPPVVMAEPVAIDPLADVKAAWEAGRRVRFNGGSWRCLKTDGDCFGWSSPREEYEIDPEPTAPVVMAMTGAITARQLCRLWDARWNAVKCGTLTDDLRVRDVEWARFGRIVLRLTMPATKAKTDDRIEPLTNPSTSGLRAGKGSL